MPRQQESIKFLKNAFFGFEIFCDCSTFESGGLIFSLFWDIYQNPMKVGDVRQGPNHGGGSNLPVFSSPTFGQEFAKWRLCMEFGKLWHLLVFKGGDTHKVCTDRTRSGIRHSHSFQIWPKLILRLFCGSILLGLGWLCVQEIEELFHRATLLSTLHSTSPPSAARPRRGAIF